MSSLFTTSRQISHIMCSIQVNSTSFKVPVHDYLNTLRGNPDRTKQGMKGTVRRPAPVKEPGSSVRDVTGPLSTPRTSVARRDLPPLEVSKHKGFIGWEACK